MNEIRRIESEADEIARIRAILSRFPMPDFVISYELELGEFDGEPSVWIRFQTTHRLPDSMEEGLQIGRQAVELGSSVLEHLRQHYPGRYPYFRYIDADSRESRRA